MTRRARAGYGGRTAHAGLAVQKSQARVAYLHDFGQYRIGDLFRNIIVAGERFNLDLDDVEAILDEIEQPLAMEPAAAGE